jgi:hypothetical protein
MHCKDDDLNATEGVRSKLRGFDSNKPKLLKRRTRAEELAVYALENKKKKAPLT